MVLLSKLTHVHHLIHRYVGLHHGEISLLRNTLISTQYAHRFHVHGTHSSQKGFLQTLLYLQLVVFVLLIFAIGLIELFPHNLHFFIESIHNIFHFIVDSLFGILFFLLLLNFSPDIPPSTESLNFHSPIVISLGLSVLYFESLLFDFVFVQKWKRLRQILDSFESVIKFTDVAWHKLNLDGLFLKIFWRLNQWMFCCQKFLMLFLIHLQVLLSVWFNSFLLILKHGLFHAHKLPNSVSLKRIEQVLQSIFEMLSVLIHNLGNDWTLAVVVLDWGRSLSIGMAGILFSMMGVLGNVWIVKVFFMHLLGIEHLGQICRGLLDRRSFGLLFPPFGDLFDIVEVGLLDKLFHIHLI